MRARRVTLAAVLAALLSPFAVGAARADDTPALTTPGSPVVVVDEPHRLTLSWTPSTWWASRPARNRSRTRCGRGWARTPTGASAAPPPPP
ncbi:hypothetical protein [Micromonospora sp. DT62]|uniref:hypothetical protein n=1 Tax=Micromonospora sp. DT62 TaxID=3416521 RepID=UPI003CF611F4